MHRIFDDQELALFPVVKTLDLATTLITHRASHKSSKLEPLKKLMLCSGQQGYPLGGFCEQYQASTLGDGS